jgi:ABC-type dipeptide/oligopeptide/nickel transport system, ATPase component
MVTDVGTKTLLDIKNISVEYAAANGVVHAVDGHWVNCFLYGDGSNDQQQAPNPSAAAH